MLLLVLDTSTPAVTAGVAALDETVLGETAVDVLAERVTINPRAHGELLTPHLTEAASTAGVALTDLDAVVCGIGPGPFTGLRAGMVTAASLAHALDIPAYPVCSLDAIAADAGTGTPLLVATDARRREVYWARYAADGTREAGPAVDPPADIDVGDARVVGRAGSMVSASAREPSYPTAHGLVRAAADVVIAREEPAPLTPLYLRRPDAAEPGERKRVTEVG
ncbi:MAG: tRNA (adenosine(37)-N6)-threonylcarbamoyltransferase complex dimerization subunit type 1 TsaB [Actinophytocola sp.]|nr:tRNA (adenosine(37)-N6)-threonylcarbamoyltransferase complex dimerization subunit type 1 TsaB [Actinophytocola sp.]